jgi:flagellar biosynthesis component FlhA
MQLQGGKPIGLWLSTQTITQKKTSFKHDYMPRYYSCIQVLASLVLGMPEILLQGLISVNFFLSIREIYFHLK